MKKKEEAFLWALNHEGMPFAICLAIRYGFCVTLSPMRLIWLFIIRPRRSRSTTTIRKMEHQGTDSEELKEDGILDLWTGYFRVEPRSDANVWRDQNCNIRKVKFYHTKRLQIC